MEIKAALSQIRDFRREHEKKQALVDILLLCVIGFICGHTDKRQSFGQNMKSTDWKSLLSWKTVFQVQTLFYGYLLISKYGYFEKNNYEFNQTSSGTGTSTADKEKSLNETKTRSLYD